jgi:hypothetical protein
MSNKVRLDEFDKDEWRSVYFGLKSDATEEEFEIAWAEFVRLKTENERQKGLQ